MFNTLSTVLPRIRPEMELILCCARTHIDPQIAGRIVSLLQEDIDWEYLTSTASQHGVMPLLYQNIQTTCPRGVPHTVLTELRLSFATHALRTRLFTNELLAILKLFNSEGMPVFPYKGPVLGASVYGDLVLRSCSDLDILVDKENVLRAKDLLLSQGYQVLEKSTGFEEARYLRHDHHFRLMRDSGAAMVELHWAITHKHFLFDLDFEELLKHQNSLNLDGCKIATLSPEDTLLLLCIHGSKHLWNRLVWICDVNELLRSYPQLNWERLLDRANSLDCRRMLACGVFLAEDLLERRVSEKVLQILRADPVAQSVCRRITRRLFLPQSIPSKVLDDFLIRMGAMSRLRDRVRYALYFAHERIQPDAKDRKLLRLPAFLSFLYYLIRPVRLVREYGLDLWKSFLKRDAPSGKPALPRNSSWEKFDYNCL